MEDQAVVVAGADVAQGVRHLSVVDVLDAIASPEPSSGAGISAGIALALATACALKAVLITLKHTEDQALRACCERLRTQRDRALERARADAELFQNYLRDHEPRDAALLVVAAEEFQDLALEVDKEIKALDGKVRSTVEADLIAARALHASAVAIEQLVIRDNRRLRARTMP